MRLKLVSILLTLLLTSLLNQSIASNQIWSGSYEADGQCFCVNIENKRVLSTIVPSPIGGQTVGQVCAKIGEGPELKQTSGLFNYPVYADAQCGHGPFLNENGKGDVNCLGSHDGLTEGSTSCKPAGSKWNLKLAYSIKPAVAAALPEKKVDSDESVNDENHNADLNLKSEASDIKPTQDKTDNATVAVKESGRIKKSLEPIQSFKGQVVVIDGVRYKQARADISATEGIPGSRIIVDDLVFLKDDGTIDPNQLYGAENGDSSIEEPVTGPGDKAKEIARPVSENTTADERNLDKPGRQFSDSPTLKKSGTTEVGELKNTQRKEAKAAGVSRITPTPEKTGIPQKKPSNAAVTAENRVIPPGKLKNESDLAGVSSNTNDTDLDKPGSQVLKPEPKSKIITPESVEKAVADKEDNQDAIDQVTGITTVNKQQDNNAIDSQNSIVSALRLPDNIRPSSREFSYLEALPINLDLGGNGVLLEVSSAGKDSLQLLGKIGIANTYQEVMLGTGYYYTPKTADRLTLLFLAGFEYGSFELTDNQNPDISVDFDDSGFYLGAATRLTLNRHVELKAGLGYSSIFEGDARLFGSGYWHLTRQLDLVSRFELGDNDLFGLGIRFYYK